MGTWHTFGGVTNTLSAGAGSSDPLGTGDQALSLTSFPAATNLSALAGVEFVTSTRGYRNLAFRFDVRATGTASRHLQTQYSVDDGASYRDGPRFVLTNAGAFQNGLSVDLRNDAAAADQPKLRVRLLCAVGAGGKFEGVAGNYSPSGTWRLDQVTFLGERLVPDPPVLSVAPPIVTFTNFITGRTHPGEPTTHSYSELTLRPGETLRLVVAVHDTNQVPVLLKAVSEETAAHWELPAVEAPIARAIFTYTATEAEAGQTRRLGLSVQNGSTHLHEWSLYVPTPAERNLVISEFLANPPAGTPEFVELVQLGRHPLDLGGWTLGDGASVRHRFASHTILPGGHAAVIFGGSDPTPTPVAGAEFLRASTGGLSLNNGGDALELRNAHSNLVERVVYRAGDLATKGSLVRAVLPDGAFRAHGSLNTQAWSPGEPSEGNAWPVIDDQPEPQPQLITTARWIEAPPGQIGFPPTLQLQWTPIGGRLARVLRSSEVGAPFEEITRDIGTGQYTEPMTSESAFYRVEWQ